MDVYVIYNIQAVTDSLKRLLQLNRERPPIN